MPFSHSSVRLTHALMLKGFSPCPLMIRDFICRPTSFYLSLSILPLFCVPRAFSWLFNPRKRLRLRVKLPFISEDQKKKRGFSPEYHPPSPPPPPVFLSSFYPHHCTSTSLWHLMSDPGLQTVPRGERARSRPDKCTGGGSVGRSGSTRGRRVLGTLV